MIKRIFILFALALLPFAPKAAQLIEVATDNTAMIFKVGADNKVLTLHYGAKIKDFAPFAYQKNNLLANMGAIPMAYATRGAREVKEPALAVRYNSGELNTELLYRSHASKREGNITSTTIFLSDVKQNLDVELHYMAYMAEDVIETSVKIINNGKKRCTLENFYSSSLPLGAREYHLYHFGGSWADEMNMFHSELTQGTKTIETKRLVRAAQSDNPSFVLTLNKAMDEESGEAIIGALAWSGNYKMNFELDEQKYLNILAGINPYTSEWILEPRESFTTPKMIYTYSDCGVGRASRNMHDWARGYGIWRGDRVRSTLLNSWEGAYFTFDTKTLTDMIDNAAAMGLEMFVLDDGWFGNDHPRDNAKAGLGDWEVNRKKLPEGIGFLADYATEKGIKFGIWIEPEMVNPNSNLAKNHPDWIVGERGRDFPELRQQLLLDLSNPKVQDFVFGVFDDIMVAAPSIHYIKWDANRHLENIGSTYLPKDKQQHFAIAYTQGLYNVYERIRAKYPDVFIQACSSGGGRVEYGALKYHDEAWTSDNTDAKSRAFMQYGMNMAYPAIVTASHISSAPNHQTKNITPLKMRVDMAMTGRMGMELQPKNMTDQERAFAKSAIETYKGVREIVTQGDLYRLISPYDKEGNYSLAYISKDKRRALLFSFCLEFPGRKIAPSLRLKGLNPSLQYKIKELNVSKSKFWANGKTLSGEFLAKEGLNPLLGRVYDSVVILLEAE